MPGCREHCCRPRFSDLSPESPKPKAQEDLILQQGRLVENMGLRQLEHSPKASHLQASGEYPPSSSKTTKTSTSREPTFVRHTHIFVMHLQVTHGRRIWRLITSSAADLVEQEMGRDLSIKSLAELTPRTQLEPKPPHSGQRDWPANFKTLKATSARTLGIPGLRLLMGCGPGLKESWRRVGGSAIAVEGRSRGHRVLKALLQNGPNNQMPNRRHPTSSTHHESCTIGRPKHREAEMRRRASRTCRIRRRLQECQEKILSCDLAPIQQRRRWYVKSRQEPHGLNPVNSSAHCWQARIPLRSYAIGRVPTLELAWLTPGRPVWTCD